MDKRSKSKEAERTPRALAKSLQVGYCHRCKKLLWPTREGADERIELLKTRPATKKSYLLAPYRCPEGADGFHIGHDYKLGLPISLCTGEMQ